jgi:hypothetical protein
VRIRNSANLKALSSFYRRLVGFQHRDDAERFQKELSERLASFSWSCTQTKRFCRLWAVASGLPNVNGGATTSGQARVNPAAITRTGFSLVTGVRDGPGVPARPVRCVSPRLAVAITTVDSGSRGDDTVQSNFLEQGAEARIAT